MPSVIRANSCTVASAPRSDAHRLRARRRATWHGAFQKRRDERSERRVSDDVVVGATWQHGQLPVSAMWMRCPRRPERYSEHSCSGQGRCQTAVHSAPRCLERGRDKPKTFRHGYLTCGIYGWIAHTCFFDMEHSARQAFDAMKLELARILARIPTEADPEAGQAVTTVVDAISRFVDRLPCTSHRATA